MSDFSTIYSWVQSLLPDPHNAGILTSTTLLPYADLYSDQAIVDTGSPYDYDSLPAADKKRFDYIVGHIIAAHLVDPLSGGGVHGHLILERTTAGTRQWALMPEDRGYGPRLLRRANEWIPRLSWRVPSGPRSLFRLPGRREDQAKGYYMGEILLIPDSGVSGGAVRIVATPTQAAATALEIQTAANGTSWTTFPDLACDYLDVLNPHDVDIEYLRNGAGVSITINAGSSRLIPAITNASQISIRRVDQWATQLTIEAEAIRN